MSKARLVITAVITEKRPVAEVARDYQVARSWIYELLARYRAEGEDAFEPRSRRPKTSPLATTQPGRPGAAPTQRTHLGPGWTPAPTPSPGI